MRATAEYLQHAIACRTLAERMTQPQDKKILEELAQAWEKIAASRIRERYNILYQFTPSSCGRSIKLSLEIESF